MSYAALRLVARLVGRLPRRWLAGLGAALGWIAGSLLRIRRSLVEGAMDRAGIRSPRQSARRMYDELGRGLAELLWAAGVTPSERTRAIASVVIDDDAVVALEHALGRGPVIFFASHTGNWELAAAAAGRLLSARGRRLVVVAKAMHARSVDRFTTRLRACLGVHVIPPVGALAAARRALAAGDVVVMPIDQVPDCAAHALAVPFLGAEAFVDRAPATLAWRTRATILVVAAQRDRDVHRVRLLGVVERASPGTSMRAWIEATAVTATSLLDAFVRSSPASWLWLHRRWRPPPQRRGGGLAAVERPVTTLPSRLVATRKAG
jgi:Kdo2-lipid IVA lauroyltransferase/acyltransferase